MKSRRSSGRQRDEDPPEFLIDRSLSQVSLPAALREVGLTVRTLAEVYGEVRAQAVEDTEWIVLAAEMGWVVQDHPGSPEARARLRGLPGPHYQALAEAWLMQLASRMSGLGRDSSLLQKTRSGQAPR
jgi:PIN like domain